MQKKVLIGKDEESKAPLLKKDKPLTQNLDDNHKSVIKNGISKVKEFWTNNISKKQLQAPQEEEKKEEKQTITSKLVRKSYAN